MRIKEITIKNFKSYIGETTLTLEIENEKNIILIGGQNGAGKSSLFEAVKICIYGPLAYGYQGMVSNYIYNIKKSINDQIFSEEDVEAFVELKIYLTIDGKEELYTINRRWTFDKSTLKEEYTVYMNGYKIIGEERDKFQKFLNNLIPPSVFDFFLFDGEKLFEIFDDKNMDKKLKHAMLTLNNLDILTFLSRELELNNRRNLRTIEDLEIIIDEINLLEKEITEQMDKKNMLSKELNNNIERHEELNLEIELIEIEFKKEGGLGEGERQNLINKIENYELERNVINQKIKDYSNTILPFIIVEDKLKDLKKQLEMESKYSTYETFRNSLNDKLIKKSLNMSNIELSDDSINSLMLSILKNIKDELYTENKINNFKMIHSLSKLQENFIMSKIDQIFSEESRNVSYYKDKELLTKKIANIRNQLRNSLDPEDEIKFIKKREFKEIEKNELNMTILKLNLEIEKINDNIEKSKKILEKKKEELVSIKRKHRVNDISEEIISFTEELISNTTKSKVKEIEKEFNYIFSQIIRKKEYIDHIKIGLDFDITIYSKVNYNAIDICRIIKNLSLVEIEEKYGQEFLEQITENNKLNTKEKILNKFQKDIESKRIYKLSKKIDLENLSSGEKQVYILSLYWALIKTSKIKIPFIIDTPYGRIDDIHREAITTKFFPNISDQVIILSTKTEVNERLYKKLKRHVSKEYILDYDVDKRFTKIKEGYFFEVI